MKRLCSRSALALFFLVACGDDDGRSRPRYRVEIDGVDVSTPVVSLTPGNQRALCQSIDGYVETHIDLEALAYFGCLPEALILGGTEAGCEQRLDECLDLAPDPIEVRVDAEVEPLCIAQLASCQASVTELEGCINLNLDLVFEVLEDWSCALYGDPQVEQQAQQMMSVLELCADIDAACNRAARPLGPD